MRPVRAWRGTLAAVLALAAVLVVALLAVSFPSREVAIERFEARARIVGRAVAAAAATACAEEAKDDGDLADAFVDVVREVGRDDGRGSRWSRGSSFGCRHYELRVDSEATRSTARFGEATRRWSIQLRRIGFAEEVPLRVEVRASWAWRIMPTAPRVVVTVDPDLSHNARLLNALAAALDANGIRFRVEKPPP